LITYLTFFKSYIYGAELNGIMKHTLRITIILTLVFLISQIFGAYTYTLSITPEIQEGQIVIDHKDTFLGETPELGDQEKSVSFVPIILAILIGTALLLLFIKLNLKVLWKYWFLFAVIITMALSFEVYIGKAIGLILAIILGFMKIFKPKMLVHNFTEIFIYTGIVMVIAPLLNLFSAVLLLVVISIYDMIAVWKSKHMIKLAKFQTESKVFAGLMIPYSGGSVKKKSDKKVRTAILGGGDIAFPLFFSAAAIEWLVKNNIGKFVAFSLSLIIISTTTIMLYLLLVKGKKNKFYPAMPFISLGCFAGFALVWLLLKAL